VADMAILAGALLLILNPQAPLIRTMPPQH
jgi:hypothetical protein